MSVAPIKEVGSAWHDLIDGGLTRLQDAPMPETWASTVPASLLEQLGSKEVRRQGILFEFIRGEQEYKKDLDTFESVSHT